MLSTRQVAEILSVHQSTVRAYFHRGMLRGKKLPTGLLRFKSSDVEEFVRENHVS